MRPIRSDIGLSYDDVLLVPQLGVLDNRAQADLTSIFVPGVELELPLISAPMTSVTEDAMAIEMARLGGLGVLHRFTEVPHRLDMIEEVAQATEKPVAAAIGLQDSMMCLDDIVAAGASILVLDVAHAHCQRVIDYIKQINDFVDRSKVKLVVGNVATQAAASDFYALAVDALKVGIGPGAACTTREVTGHGIPQLTAIMDVRREFNRPIIADGGIKNSGDIVKALAAGADTVMIGRLFAGSDEAPYAGEYFGMASRRINGHNAPEGVEGTVERTGPVAKTVKELAWGIRSGISYAGTKSAQSLRYKARFMQVAPGTVIETSTRL